jgi:hypothetical protein
MLRALAKAKRARKAQMREFIVAVIILLFSAAMIFIFIEKARLSEVSGKQACRQSVELRSEKIAKGLAAAGITEVPLNCKTEPITISTTNEEEIKEKIANAMQECWWMLGEGQLVFFTDTDKVAHCLICSTIEFDEKVQKKIPTIEIGNYLSTTIVPGKNITYLEYLSGGLEVPKNQQSIDFTLSTSKKYAVLFLTGKGTNLNEVITLGAEATVALLIGVFTGGALLPLAAGGLATASVTKTTLAATGGVDKYYTLIQLTEFPGNVEKVCDRIETIP